METAVLVVLTLIGIVALIIWEYRNQDCINGKPCKAGAVNVTIDPNLPIQDKIQLIQDMVTKAINYNTWRLAFIVALLLSIPIAYLINGYFPTFRQWLVVLLLVFIGAYFSSSWLWSHWVQPNAAAIERNLSLLS